MQPTAKFQYVQLLSKTDKHILFYRRRNMLQKAV